MSFEGCESAFYKSFGTSSDTSCPAAVLTGWPGRGGQSDSGAAVPTAGVVRGLVPRAESPTPCLVPFFHLHLETTALHLPLTGFQICPLTWLDLHSPEEPHARSQWKTGPEPTSRTLTPTSLAHTPAWRPESARLTSSAPQHPQPQCHGGLCGKHRPTCPPCTKALRVGAGPQKRAFYPPGKPPEPNAAIREQRSSP